MWALSRCGLRGRSVQWSSPLKLCGNDDLGVPVLCLDPVVLSVLCLNVSCVYGVVCMTTCVCLSVCPSQQGLPFPGSPAHTFLCSPPPFLQEEPKGRQQLTLACDHRLLTLIPTLARPGQLPVGSPSGSRL